MNGSVWEGKHALLGLKLNQSSFSNRTVFRSLQANIFPGGKNIFSFSDPSSWLWWGKRELCGSNENPLVKTGLKRHTFVSFVLI